MCSLYPVCCLLSFCCRARARYLLRTPFFFVTFRVPPRSTLFPYTTLFRSMAIPTMALKVLERRPAGRRYVFDLSVEDRKSTRLNSSHLGISYAVFCLKKKTNTVKRQIDHSHERPKMIQFRMVPRERLRSRR